MENRVTNQVVPKLSKKKPVVSQIPKPVKHKNTADKQKDTNLGFKAVKKITKKEQVKAAVHKSKVRTDTVASRNKKHSFTSDPSKENCNSKKEPMKRSKMPNFAMIHQKALDKLENLKEMSERKAARAQLLLSGLKPVSESPVKVKSPAKCRTMLLFSPKPVLPITEPVKNPTNSSKIVHSVSNPKVVPKPVVSRIPIPARNNNLAENKKFTRLGFKVIGGAGNIPTREEQVKAIVNKNKVPTDTAAIRRNVIQNVRTNRTYELLIKMRNK